MNKLLLSRFVWLIALMVVGTSEVQGNTTVVLAGMMPTWLQVFLTDKFEFKNLEEISPTDMSSPVLKYQIAFKTRSGELYIKSQESQSWRTLSAYARRESHSNHFSARQSSTPVSLIIWPSTFDKAIVLCLEDLPCLTSFPKLNRALNAELEKVVGLNPKDDQIITQHFHPMNHMRRSAFKWPIDLQYWFDMEKGKLVSAGDFPLGIRSMNFDYRRIGDLVEASVVDRGQGFRFQLFHGPAEAKINLNE